jgi:hypothetical protein
MKLTKEFLVEKRACEGGMKWYGANKPKTIEECVEKLCSGNSKTHIQYANWLIVRVLTLKNVVLYAKNAAYAAAAYAAAAYAADDDAAAYAAAYAAAAYSAADDAADAAYADAADDDADDDAAYDAAYAAAYAAATYAANAAYAAYAFNKKLIEIITFGLKLLAEQESN